MATGINAEAQVTAPQDSTGGWPLTATYSLEAGAERAFNTYLSPLLQKGGSFALDGSWTRGCAAPRHRLALSFGARYRMGFLRNPARNASMTDINLALQCDLQRSLKLPGTHPSLKLAAGAGLLVDGGILYLPGNSNNPVAARLYAGLTLNGTASYDIRVRGHLIRLIDEICMPTLGIFFSPHFGQSYYEIYLGEHSGLAHCMVGQPFRHRQPGGSRNTCMLRTAEARIQATDHEQPRIAYRLAHHLPFFRSGYYN